MRQFVRIQNGKVTASKTGDDVKGGPGWTEVPPGIKVQVGDTVDTSGPLWSVTEGDREPEPESIEDRINLMDAKLDKILTHLGLASD